jgi:hypothetical protein
MGGMKDRIEKSYSSFENQGEGKRYKRYNTVSLLVSLRVCSLKIQHYIQCLQAKVCSFLTEQTAKLPKKT